MTRESDDNKSHMKCVLILHLLINVVDNNLLIAPAPVFVALMNRNQLKNKIEYRGLAEPGIN